MTVDYKKLGADLGELLNSKQAAYGQVFEITPAILGLLFPDGIPVLAYRDVLTIVRMLDKIGRICTAAGRGDPGGEDPWRDIAGYAMLALGQRERQQQKDEIDTEAYLNDPGPEPSDTVDDEAEKRWWTYVGFDRLGDMRQCTAVYPSAEAAERAVAVARDQIPGKRWEVRECDERGKLLPRNTAVPPMRYRVAYGDPEDTMTTWGWYEYRKEADHAAERCREEHPESAVRVEDMGPLPSNEWALTWSNPAIRRAFIESVFPTREQAEAMHAEMAAKQPGLTWCVCRVDEVGK